MKSLFFLFIFLGGCNNSKNQVELQTPNKLCNCLKISLQFEKTFKNAKEPNKGIINKTHDSTFAECSAEIIDEWHRVKARDLDALISKSDSIMQIQCSETIKEWKDLMKTQAYLSEQTLLQRKIKKDMLRKLKATYDAIESLK